MRATGSTLLETWATSPSSPQQRRDVLTPLAVPGAQQLPRQTAAAASPAGAGALPASDSALGELKLALQRQQARQQQQQQQHQQQQQKYHHHQHYWQQETTSPTPRSRRTRQTRLHEHLKVVKRSVSPAITKQPAPASSSTTAAPFPAIPLALAATPAPLDAEQSADFVAQSSGTLVSPVHGPGGAGGSSGVAATTPAVGTASSTSPRKQRQSTTPQADSMRQSRASPRSTTAGTGAGAEAGHSSAGASDASSVLRTELAALGYAHALLDIVDPLTDHSYHQNSMMPAVELFQATVDDLQARNSDLTLPNFLQALATRHSSNTRTPSINTRAASTSSQASMVQNGAFSALESPTAPQSELPQQSQQSLQPSPPMRANSSEQLYSPRPIPPLLPPLEPTTPRSQRLQAFANIHTPPASQESIKLETSARSTRSSARYSKLASANALSSLTNAAMVAAQVDGMGRVALSRQVLVDQLGPENAEQAIAAAAAASFAAQAADDAQYAPAFGSSRVAVELEEGADGVASLTSRRKTSFNVFDAPSFKSRLARPKRRGGKGGFHILDDKLNHIRSWLASDDEEDLEDENRDKTWVSVPDSWRKDQQWASDEATQIKQRRLEPALEYSREHDLDDEDWPREGDSQGRVRVGGKSVRPLLHTKRQRLLADEDDDESKTNGKNRAHAGVVNCICGRIDTVSADETMVQCDDCHDWMHLDCLDFASADQLPSPYFCHRCADERADRGRQGKRSRRRSNSPVIGVSPSTPMLSSEPTLVATSFSPRASGSFYRSSTGGDLLLAPSPMSSPTRRHVQVPPRSPQHMGLPQMPVTPKLSTLPKADYTPRSPLFYRGGRSRVVSGHFEEGAWIGGWDSNNNFGYDDHTAVASEDTWHDLTMTPSRTVSNTLEWETPNSSRRASTVFGSGTHTGPRSAAQDFLATLHHDDNVGIGHSRAPSYNQRLFGSPVHHHGHTSSPTASQSFTGAHDSSALLAPHSPTFSMKNGPVPARGMRSRVPSIPFGLNAPSSHYASAPSHMSALSAGNPFALGHSRMPSNPFTSSHQRLPSSGYGASLRGSGQY
ncbi:hypothetical protein OIV83_002186 [Microbotryomycetes sp. JL201]|nr:hypothetical protein OIV83_002186 [Microbotryomycetes sp. JL201]